MLQSFRGTVDRGGIRTFRLERDDDFARRPDKTIAEFWAVLNRTELPPIRAALASGDRARATQMVCERAVSLGTVLPDKYIAS